MQIPSTDRQISGLDEARLRSLLRRARAAGLAPELADRIEEALDSAEVLPVPEIAPDVVTMRTRLQVRSPAAAGEVRRVTLCYPDEADAEQGQISVFSPFGLALLGAQAGQPVRWRGPRGEWHEVRIEALEYQPEAAGDLTV